MKFPVHFHYRSSMLFRQFISLLFSKRIFLFRNPGTQTGRLIPAQTARIFTIFHYTISRSQFSNTDTTYSAISQSCSSVPPPTPIRRQSFTNISSRKLHARRINIKNESTERVIFLLISAHNNMDRTPEGYLYIYPVKEKGKIL